MAGSTAETIPLHPLPILSSSSSLMCPTCVAFSDSCCQQENGFALFREFLEANTGNNYWDAKLSEALASLR